ncbi:MAG: ABC transporter ATP-binding protein [bacterium]|nr:ABC transporter ATP-binding protein [bacterium]
MSKIRLEIEELEVQYGSKVAISDISFSLNKGQIVAIVGESGSGKSTLLKSLSTLNQLGGTQSHGKIKYCGKDIAEMTPSERKQLLGVEIGMIFQNPQGSFNPLRTYRKQFIETLKSHGLYDKNTFDIQIAELFEKLNLTGASRILASRPYEMSGGMNQRIAIALALLLEPKVLLADEPTSALDVSSQIQVLEELIRIKQYFQTSILFVTHNVGAAAMVADKIGVMYKGRLVEFGNSSEVLYEPKHEYTKRLLAAVPKMKKEAPAELSSSKDALLELNGVNKVYFEKEEPFFALNHLQLSVRQGEILGVVGESGSGKSTLLKVVAGLQSPTDGSIYWKGKEITNKKRTKEDYREIQMIFQNARESLNPRRKIRDTFGETIKNLQGIKKKSERDKIIDHWMERVGLPKDLADRYPSQLSGGQCQRVAIARAIAVKPKLLLCDEITSALDVSVQEEVVRLLMKLVKEEQITMIFVTHDLSLVSNISETIMVMQGGNCVEYGSTHQVICHSKHSYTKRLLDAVID